ncbi:MAG TPA: addiction module protein [Steroidobacteraceae bacterium]|nr:addiction module protein [Steroidobacteraceae bacterium]
MELSAEQRAQLADELVESLDSEALSQLDKKWTAEAKRRRDETRSGYSQTISGQEALQQVRDAIKK